jgi:beta-glucoside operon transcriptional antiterminator
VEEFYDMFLKKDKRFKTVEKKIKVFVKKSFQHELSLQEMVYLMVHMNKAIS